MKPPICELCGRAFDPGQGGGMATFADYEPLPDGMTGHPEGCIWLCRRHLAAGRELGDRLSGAALKTLRRRFWISWLRGLLHQAGGWKGRARVDLW